MQSQEWKKNIIKIFQFKDLIQLCNCFDFFFNFFGPKENGPFNHTTARNSGPFLNYQRQDGVYLQGQDLLISNSTSHGDKH